MHGICQIGNFWVSSYFPKGTVTKLLILNIDELQCTYEFQSRFPTIGGSVKTSSTRVSTDVIVTSS